MKNTILFLLCLLAPIIGQSQSFITTWKTDNPGTSNATSITIPTTGGGYSYDVDWNNDGIFDEFGITGDVTHDFILNGTYTIRIQGNFPRIYFNNTGDKDKIIAIVQWGSISWTSMQQAFAGASNLQILSLDLPDLSNVTSMEEMFHNASSFNQNISGWNVSAVTNMNAMFKNASSFNQSFGTWNVEAVTNMNAMFQGASSFNQDIGGWNVAAVTDMNAMFQNASSFDQDIGGWNVAAVNDMSNMFRIASSFNQDIGGWNVGAVTTMSIMFFGASSFNQDIGGWNVAAVINMTNMFQNASAFDQDIGGWNVGAVNDMSNMFFNASAFDQDIGAWNVSAVTRMKQMFRNASAFDQDIGGWNVGVVNDMYNMFFSANAFDQDIGAWNVSAVTDINSMLKDASSFNQDIGGWNIAAVTNMSDMLLLSGLSITNYDNTLIGWDAGGYTNKDLGNLADLIYCNGETARTNMDINKGWTFSGDVLDCSLLPIELISFNGRRLQNNIQLEWRTGSEDNNVGFEIQKSDDGKDWKIIGFVDGGGTTDEINAYKYQDANPFSGINYYRLRQIDLDRSFEYSKVISVFAGKENKIEIYPNPTTGILEIIGIDRAEIKIIDSYGRTVRELMMINQNINISSLSNGLYFISVKTENGVITKRIIKE